LFLLGVAAASPSIAQTDTTIKYYGKNARETTKDSAFSYVKFFRDANLWHGMEYYTKRNVLKSDGSYNELNFDSPVGNVSNYKEDGSLDYTAEYIEGRLTEKIYFYKSGGKKSLVVYGDNAVQQQKGWDEAGKEIKNYVVAQEARFKGGLDGWKKYLEKNLNSTIAADVGAPAGTYEVKLQFVVNKDGVVTNLKAVSVPPKCKPCGAEALRVLRESPEWEPALQNNEPVLYQALQTITFEVPGDKKKT
jgi:antitoxin component YwqK of YwqJK toxin-antitoxin module